MRLTAEEICTACKGQIVCGRNDIIVTGIKTDSRSIENGDLFVPIKGEKTDAHVFIDDVFFAGAAASFTENSNETPRDNGTIIYVENTLSALQQLAIYYRSKYSIPVIGITGSVGKTTTKEMVALALSATKNVMFTKGNQNSQIGLPITMMQLEKGNDCAVIEMGMSDFGEMSRLAAIAKPNIAVMTNIGLSHIGQLKTQNNIMLEKLHITDGWDESGILFLNGDDDYLSKLHGKLPFTTVTYGTKENSIYRATGICECGGATAFDVVSSKGKVHVYLPALGIHNVLNATAAIAVADALSIPMYAAADKLKTYASLSMRQQIHKVGGVTIIDDSYNASPDSVKSGIDVLVSQTEKGRKIAVLGDMKELGEYSEKGHREIGKYAAEKKVDIIFAVGSEIDFCLKAASESSVECRKFDSNNELAEDLLKYLIPGDTVLVKGSRSMHTEEIVKILLEKL